MFYGVFILPKIDILYNSFWLSSVSGSRLLCQNNSSFICFNRSRRAHCKSLSRRCQQNTHSFRKKSSKKFLDHGPYTRDHNLWFETHKPPSDLNFVHPYFSSMCCSNGATDRYFFSTRWAQHNTDHNCVHCRRLILVFCGIVFRGNHQTPAFPSPTIHHFDNVNHLLLIR